MSKWGRLLLILIVIAIQTCWAIVSLRTSTKIQGPLTQQQVHKFLATPANWPEIVLSSWSVEALPTDSYETDQPLRRSNEVTETFGLPPLLPLKVTWTCVESNYQQGRLDVQSTEGLRGVASDCRMLFDISKERKDDAVAVHLTMEYEPQNLLGLLAVPALAIDNALALKVILPAALHRSKRGPTPLHDFQRLMGNLYGISGLAHFLDCLVGDSQLLTMAGCPPFYELSLTGQALALLWCAAGPVAFATSRVAGLESAGLFLYGAIEVSCAALASSTPVTRPEIMDPLIGAVAVQALVAASWFHSSQKKAPGQNTA